jgi:hypothetical protein
MLVEAEAVELVGANVDLVPAGDNVNRVKR